MPTYDLFSRNLLYVFVCSFIIGKNLTEETKYTMNLRKEKKNPREDRIAKLRENRRKPGLSGSHASLPPLHKEPQGRCIGAFECP